MQYRGESLKHHDSIIQAEKKMTLTLKQLAKWSLPATPINYAIAYEYVSEKNTPLITRIDQHLFSHNDQLDNFTIEELYQQFILGQSALRDEMFGEIGDVVEQVQSESKRASQQSQQYTDHLSIGLKEIESGEAVRIERAVAQLKKSTEALKEQQKQLSDKMQASASQARKLQQELNEVRKEIYLDPITGLYNKKALTKHFDAWVAEMPDKQIAAVVVNVDHFKEFSDKFGSLIGDVILSKIANKISNYVGESGLPVRTGNEEFFILLPEVETSTANEIAEKMRQGVEKIRFISSKSGIRLPKMTISLGISEFQKQESLHSLIRRTKSALLDAQKSGNNSIALA